MSLSYFIVDLSSYADIITAVFKTVYLPIYIDNCTYNTAGMNKLKINMPDFFHNKSHTDCPGIKYRPPL